MKDKEKKSLKKQIKEKKERVDILEDRIEDLLQEHNYFLRKLVNQLLDWKIDNTVKGVESKLQDLPSTGCRIEALRESSQVRELWQDVKEIKLDIQELKYGTRGVLLSQNIDKENNDEE